MLAAGVPWAIWSFVGLLGGGVSSVAFNVAAGCFFLLAIGYVGLHGRRGLAWYSVPVLLTLRALAEFIAVPVWRFASGADLIDSAYVQAMILILIGFVALWVGSLVFMKEVRLRFVPQVGNTSSRVAFMSAAMLGLGFCAKLVIWKLGLFSYTADASLRESSLSFLQWLNFFADLLTAALVVSAIEVFGKQSAGSFIKIVLWLSVVLSVCFGVISGMKEELLKPLLFVVLANSIIKGRVPRSAFLLPLLLLLIYPFVNAYRSNLNSGDRAYASSLSGLGTVLEKSFAEVVDAPFSTTDQGAQSLDDSTDRLSTLTCVHDIVGLPSTSKLNGAEDVWLAPIYPLVPRFLWKDKPVFNKGQRLSVALGRPDTTSSAVTPVGDLFSLYGTLGVVVGMLLYGIVLQLYMNWAGPRAASERGLFVYLLMLMPLINLEADATSLVANAVQIGIVSILMSYVIYGQSASALALRQCRLSTATS